MWLQKTVSDLLFIVPIKRKLQQNTKKEIRTYKIHQLLGLHIFDDEDVTVGEWVDLVHIVDYTKHLENIYEEAQYLHNLKLKVAEVLNACQAKEFTFKAVDLNRTIKPSKTLTLVRLLSLRQLDFLVIVFFCSTAVVLLPSQAQQST